MLRGVDRLLGLLAAVIGGAIWISATRLPTVPVYGDVGPAYFPRLIGIGLIATGVLLLVTSVLYPHPGREPAGAKISGRVWVDVGLLVFTTALYIAFMRRVGFVVSTTSYLGILSMIFGSRRYGQILLVSVGTTAVLFLLFKGWLRVPLPT